MEYELVNRLNSWITFTDLRYRSAFIFLSEKEIAHLHTCYFVSCSNSLQTIFVLEQVNKYTLAECRLRVPIRFIRFFFSSLRTQNMQCNHMQVILNCIQYMLLLYRGRWKICRNGNLNDERKNCYDRLSDSILYEINSKSMALSRPMCIQLWHFIKVQSSNNQLGQNAIHLQNMNFRFEVRL